MKQKYKGILFIVLSAFCFAMMNVFVRLAGDLPFYQKAFFRNIVALIFAGILLCKDHIKGKRIKLSKGSLKYLFFRCFFGSLGLLCNFYAVDNLVMSDAAMLQKMSPFFAILCSILVLKEKITPFQGFVVIGAFVGALFVIKPTFANLALFPAFIGLLGGFGAGTAYTMVRKLGEMNVKGSFVVFCFSAFSTVIILPFMIVFYQPMAMWQLLILILAGLCATGGQFSITAAYFNAPAREVSVYEYSQIIFAAVFGLFIFGQIPDLFSILGYIIIVFFAVLMFCKTNSLLFFRNKSKD